MKLKILINHSNHVSTNWGSKQKAGWVKIVDISFPNIPPSFSTEDVEKLVDENLKRIETIVKTYPGAEIYIMLQGEFSYCYIMFTKLQKYRIKIAIPTTERLVEMKDGAKITRFEFNQWRIL